MVKVGRALVSVSDKTGLEDFARGLVSLGVEILSTGGTAKMLQQSSIPVPLVSDYTGFPEIMGGRVKTLHPKIHGGILARRDNPDDMAAAREHGIRPIDMVVVNLYPFAQTIAKPDVTLAEAVEQIDIGGPCMLRAAAKNHAFVAAVCNPARYEALLDEMKQTGALSESTLLTLAAETFAHTAAYDAAITRYLGEQSVAGIA